MPAATGAILALDVTVVVAVVTTVLLDEVDVAFVAEPTKF